MSTWAVTARKKTSRFSLTWISRIIRFLASCMPYRVGVLSGAVIGFTAYYLLSRERNRTLAHLSAAFGNEPPDRLRKLARACFIHLGKALLEIMLVTPGRLGLITDVRGRENLQKALSLGKGVIYVAGHIGNWELMGHVIASIAPLSVVAAPIEPEQVNEMIVGLRAGMGLKTILRGRPGASRELIRVFRENRVLGLLIDQDTDVESVFVNFMGRPSWTPTAAASMALKFGAPVVFGTIERGKGNRHTVTIDGPLELIRTGDDEGDILANTAMFTKKIEDSIMKNPEQWVWMHRRWRRQP